MTAARWFNWANYLMIIFLAIHIVTGYAGLEIPTRSPEAVEMVRMIESVDVRYSWPSRRVVDTLNGFMFQWGAMLLVVILLNMAFARHCAPSAPPQFVRWTNTIVWALCSISCVFFWSVPHIICFGLIALFFLMSNLTPEKKA